MKLSANEIEDLKKELIKNIESKRELNAYVEIPSLCDGKLESKHKNHAQDCGNKDSKHAQDSINKDSNHVQDCANHAQDSKDSTKVSKNTESSDNFGKIPILIKDNICVKGQSANAGSKILSGFISPYNATAINKLHQSNMCAFGRANMDEFGMGSTTESSHFGACKNPHDLTRVPGGSSGGSAAAVASGLAIASLGSDTGGSIRQPASYCGVVGLKPSYGCVSRYGLIAYSSSLEQIGPITQNVEDASILLDIISGSCKHDSTCLDLPPSQTHTHLDSKKRYKIALLPEFVQKASDSVKTAYEAAVKKLESMGHTLVSKQMLNVDYHISAYYIIAMAEASSNLSRFDGVRYGSRVARAGGSLSDLYFDTRAQFGDEVKKRVLLGSFVLSSGYYDAYYLKAQKVRALIKSQFEEIFKDCDMIFLPVAPTIAPHFNASKTSLEMYLSDIYTIGVNLAGLPAISLPVGSVDSNNAFNLGHKYGNLDSKKLPIGMQFIGKNLGEQEILNAAYALEKEI
ncbi:Asp-tRNA(Asn)/Glu-tRNA(Gln) amidotransferase subunit GatA [Helicobacter saguini]|uniref:Glutamyl-tRNA(Gln) amidotransferase subunit A n=2 Tax=Helicobacter saguini TaxID=1548018 RepID=A0A347VMJ5_9HELI|nr:Asp-tRNA(Asn)/Glu-tRNA(Gln) amidotransferase subunit GatA [Helicobacter saguini]MWV61090.1 Asp-tRNA(Asn)/Glu-tRNA(Gln) amidotransferase subunit GatA [Helicobacter saguini]MWV68241.1 Asp-tRNA(Asn)/Glu-tRNA(Gln) amidotransferase subunit GatA [Helicobacter saguini]MWV70295.1 Asp-tRNA(Asn)/Glu-tRNA(Gln) amidotransferase subunit GatA [Helicobacter saguini]MWV72197.1 Asp-tRNA(Asn)/Glu-tRNA(Gln) amidotransferase subunit GatA [Helicobacter saguini]TLD95353.1 Asp-tRNA(Asn)/Glu-tRNA(Gln) amidotransfe